MRAMVALLILSSLLVAGCTDSDGTPDEAEPGDGTQDGKRGNGAATSAAASEDGAEPAAKEVAGISGSYVLEMSGSVSSSINRCQSGQSEFTLSAEYPTLVAVLRWEPAESALRVTLDAERGRNPQPATNEEPGRIRATWDALEPGTYRIGAAPATEVVVATDYHVHAVAVPAGVDPSSVDPVAMAAVPGGC